MDNQVEIAKIRIINFRSILDETISFENFNIFVGLNDSGKSNILKALNLFFNNETDFGKKLNFKTDYCQNGKVGQGKAKEITIEVTFKLPDNVADKGEKAWRKVWRKDGLHSDNLDKIFSSYSKGPTYLRRVSFKYVPAVKSQDYFEMLLVEMYESMTASANAQLSQVNKLYSDTLQDLTKQLSVNIKNNVGLDSVIQMPDDLGILFKDMKISTNDEFISGINLNNRGDGIKARHIPSMLNFISQKILESREKNAVSYTVIWGYEEPENGVEFLACEHLARELYEYSKDWQMFITTHSPAIYMKKEEPNTICYYTYKDERGFSKYDSQYSRDELDDRMGLMPLIAPHIEKIYEDLQHEQEEKETLKSTIKELNEFIENEIGKILIYTEGITDEMYLKEYLKNRDYFSRIVFNPGVEEKDFGDSNLDNRFKTLQCTSDKSIKICVFDRDNIKYIVENNFVQGKNNTYKFSIPKPSHRSEDDLIAIEHYFKDEEIIKADNDGYRMFLLKEFRSDGTTADDKYYSPYPVRIQKKNPLHILDGRDENSRVVLRSQRDKNIALVKKKFAEHVVAKDEGFDFNMSEFALIADVIEKIIDSAESRKGNE